MLVHWVNSRSVNVLWLSNESSRVRYSDTASEFRYIVQSLDSRSSLVSWLSEHAVRVWQNDPV
jgi:hypothetical protein